jgi:hypothetical protein
VVVVHVHQLFRVRVRVLVVLRARRGLINPPVKDKREMRNSQERRAHTCFSFNRSPFARFSVMIVIVPFNQLIGAKKNTCHDASRPTNP